MTAPLRVVSVVEGTSVDGPGFRTSIYLAGCTHRCPGCHNPSTWPADAGSDMSVAELLDIIDREGAPVTLSGGDPMLQAEALLPLAQAIARRGLTLWVYTGFTFAQLLDMPHARRLLEWVTVVVDGPYVASLRDTSLRFRGSSNQRLIDVAPSLRSGTPVPWRDDF